MSGTQKSFYFRVLMELRNIFVLRPIFHTSMLRDSTGWVNSVLPLETLPLARASKNRYEWKICRIKSSPNTSLKFTSIKSSKGQRNQLSSLCENHTGSFSITPSNSWLTCFTSVTSVAACISFFRMIWVDAWFLVNNGLAFLVNGPLYSLYKCFY